MRKGTPWQGGTPTLLLFIFLAGHGAPAAAQSDFPVVVSGGIHAMTAPWHLGPMTSHLNPAFMIGTDRSIRSGDHWSFFYGVNLGFFRHRWWLSGISLEPEIGIGRTLPGGFHADMRLGLGYMHYFWRRETLELEDGRYVQATEWGKPSVVMPLSVTLGYRGRSDRPLSVSPFVSARWAGQGLFLEEVPAMTHLFLMGGVRIERGRETPNEGR